MPRQPEGKLVSRTRSLLKRRGARVFNIHGGDNPFQEVGIPDLLVCYRGRFLGLEAKQPGEEPSPRQRYVLREIEKAGGHSLAFTTVAQVERLLAKVDRECNQ